MRPPRSPEPLLWLAFLFLPYALGRYFAGGEEAVLDFSTAYDLTLFYPGSNRLVSFLPLLGSVAPTQGLATFLQVGAAVLLFGLGSLAFLGRSARLPLAIFAALCAIFVLPRFSFFFSNAEPYAAPLGIVLLLATANRPDAKPKNILVILALQAVALFVACGNNPSAALLAGLYEGVILLWVIPAWRCDEASLAANLVGALRRNYRGLCAALLSAAAIQGWLAIMSHYALHFPYSTLSNFSKGDYTGTELDWGFIVHTYDLFAGFVLSRVGVEGVAAWRGALLPDAGGHEILAALLLLPLPLCVLSVLMAKGDRQQELRARAGRAAALYASALILAVALCSIPHVAIATSVLRGRYFQMSFLAILLALALALGDVLSQILEQRPRRILAAALAAASLIATFPSGIHDGERAVMKERRAVADSLRQHQIAALTGDYWLVWPTERLLNKGWAKDGPAVVPVTNRMEAFSLRAFRPMLRALWEKDEFSLACIRRTVDTSQPICEDWMAAQENLGSLPRGYPDYKGGEEIGPYQINYYAFRRLAGKDMTLRAEAVPETPDGQKAFLLRAGGLVLTSGPWAGQDALTVTLGDGEPVSVQVPARGEVTAQAERRRFVIRRDGARIMIENDGLALFSQRLTRVVIGG